MRIGITHEMNDYEKYRYEQDVNHTNVDTFT